MKKTALFAAAAAIVSLPIVAHAGSVQLIEDFQEPANATALSSSSLVYYSGNTVGPTTYGTLVSNAAGDGVAQIANGNGFDVPSNDSSIVGFVQRSGSITENFQFTGTTGAYSVQFLAAGRPTQQQSPMVGGPEPLDITLNGNSLEPGYLEPSQGVFSTYAIPLGVLTNGSTYSIKFAGTGDSPDLTTFVDNINVVAVPAPSTLIGGACLLVLAGAVKMRGRLLGWA